MKHYLSQCNLRAVVGVLRKYGAALDPSEAFLKEGYAFFASRLDHLNNLINEGGLDEDEFLVADHPVYSVILGHVEVKAYHPITCLNPVEWFKPVYLKFDLGIRHKEQSTQRLMVSGQEGAWWNLSQCQVRNVSHDLLTQMVPQVEAYLGAARAHAEATLFCEDEDDEDVQQANVDGEAAHTKLKPLLERANQIL